MQRKRVVASDRRSRLPLRSVLIGSVVSSEVTLAALYAQSDIVEVNGVFGLAESESTRVSGYRRLDSLAHEHNTFYSDFTRINDPAILSTVRELEPDVIWVVGLSQLVGAELRAVATIGCVGFHPTQLPLGRGRAPIAWIILDNVPAAATFFMVEDGADSGPILAQVLVATSSGDDAATVLGKLYEAIPEAVSRACSVLCSSIENVPKQEEARATYLGVRRDVDGVVDWSSSSDYIDRLIRSAAPPHPGAWTFSGTTKIRLLKCRVLRSDLYRGVAGRILDIGPENELVIATGDGAVEISDYVKEAPVVLNVGMKLGASSQSEILILRRKIEVLEMKLDRIVRITGSAGAHESP